MAQTKHQIQSILSEISARPRQRFGQNFMIDQNLVRLVAEAGHIKPGDLVIEVGPGTGTLTEELLASSATVLAVEIDKALVESLRNRFASKGNFVLLRGDALAGKHKLNSDLLAAIQREKRLGKTVRLVANLPYNVASPLIVELLIAGVNVLAFTVQKEVADRLCAEPNSKEYGTLSIVVQLMSNCEILRTMPPQAFWPMPKVSSALVRLMRNDRLGERADEFGKFLQRIFSSRRKTLRNAVNFASVDAEDLIKIGIDPLARPEQLSPDDFVRLFESSRGR
jgi:16S rRNA (adenine1518-N6/adenine1519-N6)-dimethyltransferase